MTELLSLNEARERRQKVGFRPSDIEHPSFLGLRKVDLPLQELVPYLDCRELHDDAEALLNEVIRGQLLQARGVYGFWPALSIGDDIVVYRAESLREEIARFPMLRQQSDRAAEYTTSLADFIAPKQSGLTDYVGAFALTAGIGAEQLAKKYERDHSGATMVAVAQCLAEAFVQHLHARLRHDAGKDEKCRGIRPALGDPACPDHSYRRKLFEILRAREIGMDLDEELALTPVASVCGLYFAHPKAHYFSVGPIAKDQVEDYASRKGMKVSEVERWLQSSLAYDPE